MGMNIVCLDLEGVLVPEIWIAFAEETGIEELKRTTRDEPDYDKLMKYRIGILKEHGLGLKEIQETIEKIEPMEGAKEFLQARLHLLASPQHLHLLHRYGCGNYFNRTCLSDHHGRHLWRGGRTKS